MTRRARPSETRIGILRAMLSRNAPLIRGHRTWFVRGWAVFVRDVDVDRLRGGGWIVPSADDLMRGTPRVLVLSETGRDLAAREAAHAVPPTHAEEIAVIVDEIRAEATALHDLAARLEAEADRLRCPAPHPDTRGESA